MNLVKERLPLLQEFYVGTLLRLLMHTRKPTDGLIDLLTQLDTLERSVQQTVGRLADISSSVDASPEFRGNPLKCLIEADLGILEQKKRQIAIQLDVVKIYACAGFHEVLAAYKDNESGALDQPFAGRELQSGLYELRNNIVSAKRYCDDAVAAIEKHKSIIHKTSGVGLHFKNLARVFVGKPPVGSDDERQRLMRLFSEPFLTGKACLSDLQATVEQVIGSLKWPEQERAAKRPSLAGKLAQAQSKVQPPASKGPGRSRGAEIG